jgi:hypothetical protein
MQIAWRDDAIVCFRSLTFLRPRLPLQEEVAGAQKPLKGRKLVAAADCTPGTAFSRLVTSSTKPRLFAESVAG